MMYIVYNMYVYQKKCKEAIINTCFAKRQLHGRTHTAAPSLH
jgi:hypothetical protein